MNNKTEQLKDILQIYRKEHNLTWESVNREDVIIWLYHKLNNK